MTAPVAVDVLEKIALPALHVGIPDTFPPLGEDDLANLRKGMDLFALWCDVIPYAHQAEEGGFLGTLSPQELGTPYPDRLNLEVGKGDWLLVNPARLKSMLDRFDGKKLLDRFDKFVEHVRAQPGVPRIADAGKGLAETALKTLADLNHAVDAAQQVAVLVFRLLPPTS